MGIFFHMTRGLDGKLDESALQVGKLSCAFALKFWQAYGDLQLTPVSMPFSS